MQAVGHCFVGEPHFLEPPGPCLKSRRGQCPGQSRREESVSDQSETRRHFRAHLPWRAARDHGVQGLGRNWKWANPTPSLGAFQEGKAPYDLRIPGLAAEAAGTVEWKSPEVITYDLTVKHSATRPGVMGGCAEFNLDLKSPMFNGQAPPIRALARELRLGVAAR